MDDWVYGVYVEMLYWETPISFIYINERHRFVITDYISSGEEALSLVEFLDFIRRND